jgi:hypothetical protein
MTLNASGPLSLGGATVGQSINLELGQSATATASINATNFRTLAGVASGQISISNFYGKSNAVGWALYIGQRGTISSNQQGQYLQNYNWALTSAGIATNISGNGGNQVGIQTFNSGGARTGSYNITGGNPPNSAIYGFNNGSYSTPIYMVSDAVNYNVMTTPGGSWNYGTSWKFVANIGLFIYESGVGSYQNASCMDSSGNFVTAGYFYRDGQQPRSGMLKISSNGSSTTANAALGLPLTNYARSVYPQSDGTYINVGIQGNNGGYSHGTMRWSSNLASCSYRFINSSGSYTGMYIATAFDRVNNIYYMAGTSGTDMVVGRFDSSDVNTHLNVIATNTGGAVYLYSPQTIEYYNGFLWTVVYDSTNNIVVVTKLNASTLALVSITTIAVTGRTLSLPSNQKLFVNSTGVYVLLTTSTYLDTFILQLPVSSTVATQTIAVPVAPGGTQNMVFTNITSGTSTAQTVMTTDVSNSQTATAPSVGAVTISATVSSVSNSQPATKTNIL